MTALLFALFAGAACLAIASMVATARQNVAAALAIGRQLDHASRPAGKPPRGGPRKPALAQRSSHGRRVVCEGLHGSRLTLARYAARPVHRRKFAEGLISQPHWLASE